MIDYSEQLIGFDARENFLEYRAIWDSYRVSNFLLQETIIKPLSVDVMVWDSIFHVRHIQLPNWTGPRQHLWERLDSLRIFISEQQLDSLYQLIGITQIIVRDDNFEWEQLTLTNPASISRGWRLIGFDVADWYLLSGLMNAGYIEEERDTLRNQWAEFLNQYHLFEDLTVALQFKSLTNGRVREHMPFYVYGLYQIESVNS